MNKISYRPWLDELLTDFPSRTRDSIIEGVYTFLDKLELRNSTFDSTAIPTILTEGVKHTISFTDISGTEVGVITLSNHHNGSTSLEMSLNGKKLGIAITDEGISQTYSEHPYGDEEHQIVTIKHLSETIEEWYTTITTEYTNYGLLLRDALENSLTTRMETAINDLQNQINTLKNTVNNPEEVSTSYLTVLDFIKMQGSTTKVGCIRSVLVINKDSALSETKSYWSNLQPTTNEQLAVKAQMIADGNTIIASGTKLSGTLLILCNTWFQGYDDDMQYLINDLGELDSPSDAKSATKLSGTWQLLAPMNVKNDGMISPAYAIKVA